MEFTLVAMLTEKGHPERSAKLQVLHCTQAGSLEELRRVLNEGFGNYTVDVLAVFEGEQVNIWKP